MGKRIRQYWRDHKKAIITILLAGSLDVLCGIVFATVEHISTGLGLYWAVVTADTVGYGDIYPHTVLGHYIAVLVMLSVVPLVAATFSLVTSGLAARHVRKEGDRHRSLSALLHKELHGKLDHIIRHHPEIPDWDAPKDSVALG